MNFKHDETASLEGVLWSCRGPWLTLRAVSAHKVNQPTVTLVGEVVLERSAISFLQVLP